MSPRRNAVTEAAPALPVSERKALSVGIAFALGCAAALSAPTLYELARLIRYPPQLAWLLPAAFDGYAGTSIWIGRRIPRAHPAARSARRNARLALALTIACNGLYHLLALAGTALPSTVRITVLVVVSSLPPLIVDRLLHLNSIANGSGIQPAAAPSLPAVNRESPRQRTPDAAPAAAAAPGSEPAAKAATSGSERPALPVPAAAPLAPASGSGGGNVVSITGSGRRSPADWATLALPLWIYHVDTTGLTPTAKQIADALRHAHPTLHVPRSDRSERNIRAATEALADADAEPEREMEAG